MWDLGTDWHVLGTGDFNGDYMRDVLLRNEDGRVTDWLSAAPYDGTLAPNPNAAYQVPATWELLGVGYFNDDGYADVMWRDAQGTLTEWLGQADGTFSAHANVPSQMPGNWDMVGIGNFNGDFCVDLLWRDENGTLKEWLGQADGSFVQNPNFAYTMGGNWELLGTGDFNGDGCTDLMWRNEEGTLSEWNGEYAWQGSAAFLQGWISSFPMGSSWELVGAGAFNAELGDDLLWRKDDGTLSEWAAQSDGSFWQGWSADAAASSGWTVAGIGDVNADGRVDVIWRDANGALETGLTYADGGLQTPEGKRWEDALATVSEFFDAISGQVSDYSSGADQDSYYDDGSDHAPFTSDFMKTWGFLPSVQSDPAAHYWDFLTKDIDPEFQEFVLNSLAGAGFSGTFDNNYGSMTQSSDGTTTFDVNGMLMRGTWHPFETSQEPIPKDAVVITGNNVGYWMFEQIGFCGFDPSAGYSPPNNGGGNTTPNATPCVETTFVTPNASIEDANRAALDASNQIAANNDWDSYEYSSIVYISNGVVGHTDPYTQHLADRVNWLGNLSQVPNGAVILGIVHNHPDISGITDTIPSGGNEGGDDWIMYRTIVDYNANHDTAHDLPRGITVDPNMLLWIRSPEDPNKTYVYDNTDKSQTAPGCSL